MLDSRVHYAIIAKLTREGNNYLAKGGIIP